MVYMDKSSYKQRPTVSECTGATGNKRERHRDERECHLMAKFLRTIVILLFFTSPYKLYSQSFNVGTNLAYWATTTPNFSAEWVVSDHYTLSATFGYNSWDFSNSSEKNPKLHHWLVSPEMKYWVCQAFERHFIGVHAFYVQYNAGGLEFPSFLSDYRYEGWGAGAGISYGYQWAFADRWGFEASLGVGYVYLNFDKYQCGCCGDLVGRGERHYVLPTKISLSILYYIK